MTTGLRMVQFNFFANQSLQSFCFGPFDMIKRRIFESITTEPKLFIRYLPRSLINFVILFWEIAAYWPLWCNYSNLEVARFLKVVT